MKSPPTQLGTLVNEVSTWNPSRDHQDKEFTYIDLGSIDQATKAITGARKISCGDAPSRARQLVKPGDILVSTVRPNLNGVAKISDALGDAIASTGFCVLRPQKDRLDSSYLFHWVRTRSFVDAMVKQATGASYPAVSDKIIFSSKLPLPPLPEQRRIAAILDEADALRAQRRIALAKLDELLQSVFIEMFGDPVTNSKKWKTLPLSKITSQINDCPHSTPVWTNRGKICLRTSNLGVGYWDWTETRYVSEATYSERSSRGYIEPGDIVLSREGTVGIAAIVKPNMKVCMGQRLVQVRVNDSFMTPDYLLRYLLIALSPKKISRLMVGSTAKHLNVKELRALAVPLPHLDLQQRFAQIAEKIEIQRQTVQRAGEKSDTLFASLQQLAFSGKL